MELSEDKAKEILARRDEQMKRAVEANPETTANPEAATSPKVVTSPVSGKPSLGQVQVGQNPNAPTAAERRNIPDTGWKNMPMEILPSGGKFYPANTTIAIRAANTKEIRHFSTIDEEDFLDVDDKINGIIEKCTQVKTAKPGSSWKDISDVDKFFILLSIRDLTFVHGENKLTMQTQCEQCGHTDKVEINRSTLDFFKLDERLHKYFNPSTGALDIKTKDGEAFSIYMPTLGVNTWLKNYAKGKSQNRKFLDHTFLKHAPFLFGDWRSMSEKTYREKDTMSIGWGHKKLSVISGIIDNLLNSVNPDVVHSCGGCGADVVAPLDFQGGVKSLFLLSDPFAELA